MCSRVSEHGSAPHWTARRRVQHSGMAEISESEPDGATLAPPRWALVTGATSGIGLQVSVALAKRGHAVTLLGRSRERLQACLALVESTARSPGQCTTELVDLSDLAEVGSVARRLRDRGQPLSLLVNNAAVMAPAHYRTGADGHELQMTVNHLAHHVLATNLLPLLQQTDGGRIVTVSSVRQHSGDMGDQAPWSPLPYDPMRSYATSKLWCLAYALWLDNALARDPAGTRSVAAHPGWARTGLHGAGPFLSGATTTGTLKLLATACLAQSASHGAVPVLDAATHPVSEGFTYLGPCGAGELRGTRSAPARVGQAASERFQVRVAEMSMELTRTSLAI